MTITFLQPDGVQITAQQARQGSAALYGAGAGRPLGGRSGFRADTPSTVLTATGTTWTLSPCSVMIDPGATTYQGMYGWATDANVTGSLTASDATYSRIDIVYIQVNDSSAGDGSGATTAPVSYLAGSPSASPAAPSLPPRSFLLGTITVPKTGGGAPTVAVNPARFVAAGGILPVASQAERDALTKSVGLAVSRGDLSGLVEVCDGTNWFSSVKRRHAEFTGTSDGPTTAGAAWQFSTLTRDGANSFNDGFVSASASKSRLTFAEAGVYLIHLKVASTANPGVSFASIKDTTNSYVHADNSNGNGTVWGITVTAGGIYIPAGGTDILFGLQTGNAVTAAQLSVRILVTKLTD